MDTLLQALTNAAPAWRQAVADVAWHHGLVAAAYLAAAWLCLLNGHLARSAREPYRLWYLVAATLGLLAANALLRGDVFLTHLLREFAKLDGWYAARRSLQYLAIGLVALGAPFAARRLSRAFADGGAPVRPVTWGLAALLMLLAVRIISAHGTDMVVNLRLLGISLGRLIEFAAIGWVGIGALRRLGLR